MTVAKPGARWERALGIEEMVANLKTAGWTGADLKSYVASAKRENFQALDSFAGGELSALKGSSLYPLMLEATALRYAMHTTDASEAGASRLAPSECPHGFRMTQCNACLRGVA